MILIYTTCESKKQAKKISHHLLQKQLCACTNTFPIQSFYWWKRKKETAKEHALLIKTTSEKFKTITKEIKKLHSYTTPCIIKIKVADVDKNYYAWIQQEVR